MFKKTVVLSIAVALIMVGLYVDSSGAAVASPSKRGSLLVFPSINTFTSPVYEADTIITIGNDSTKTYVKCYWMDYNQNAWDFEFELTANQPVWFSAKTGEGTKDVSEFGDNNTGELKCWAVDIDPDGYDTEIVKRHNYLYGSALYFESTPWTAAYEYQAWAFALAALPVDPAGDLPLDGDSYDNCPAYAVYNFFAEDGDANGFGFGASYLSIAPCQQDLRQDKSPVCTKVKFDVWNENEGKLTGAYQCVKCFYEGILSEIGTLTWNKCDLGVKCKKTGVVGRNFTYDTLHTDLGRFRATPSTFSACNGVFAKFGQDGTTVSDVCSGNNGAYPFVSLLVTELSTEGSGLNTYMATTGTGAGTGADTVIKWDAGEKVADGAAKR